MAFEEDFAVKLEFLEAHDRATVYTFKFAENGAVKFASLLRASGEADRGFSSALPVASERGRILLMVYISVFVHNVVVVGVSLFPYCDYIIPQKPPFVHNKMKKSALFEHFFLKPYIL